MASEKLVPTSSLIDWLYKTDPAFASAVHDGCYDQLLESTTGLTFLMPDQSTRNEIIKLTDIDPEAAAKILRSYIMPETLHQSSDFRDRQVGNKAGVAFEIDNASAGTVTAKGFKLKKQGHGPSGQNIAVWHVVQGRPPTTGRPYTPPLTTRHTGARRRVRHGGGSMPLTNRQNMAVATEAAFKACMMSSTGCKTYNPYLSKVYSLLIFLKRRDNALFLTLMPMVDYDVMITYYLLLEPYKTRGDYLIPDELLFGDNAWNGAETSGTPVTEYKALIAELYALKPENASDPQTKASTSPYVYKDPASVLTHIDTLRGTVRNVCLTRAKLPQCLQEAYTLLIEQNTISGLGPILPDKTIGLLAHGKKLWQDEFRFTLHAWMYPIRKQFVLSDFEGVIAFLREQVPGNDYVGETQYTNVNDMVTNVAPKYDSLATSAFLASDDFMFMMPPEHPGPFNRTGLESPASLILHNRQALAITVLDQMTPSPVGLDPVTLGRLRDHITTHGKLPDEITELLQQQTTVP